MSGQHQPGRRCHALAFVGLLALALLAGCSGGSEPTAAVDPPPSSTAATPTTVTPVTVRQPAGSGPRPPTGAPVTLAFGGDVHFEGVIRSRLESNPATALGPIASVLRQADLAMVNLETAVTTGGTPAGKEFNFRAPPSAFRALQGAGVDVATMANNHGEDYGLTGLRDSLAAAEAAHFPVVGIGRDATQAFGAHAATVKGQRIAIIGATQVLDSSLAAAWSAGPGKPGLASAYQESRLLAAVREVRRTADTVVVFLHWGKEGGTCPISRQRALAPGLVAAGADVVVGSHAHVLLGAGFLDGAYVSYGLGNFVFYARGGLAAESGVLTLTVQGRAVTGVRWTPARISGGVPIPLGGAEAQRAQASWRALRSCTGLSATP